MSKTADVEVSSLMAHAEWVRQLALRLVRDPEIAEDLAQETMLAALEREGPIHRMRGFLRAVLQNLMREHFRGEYRRQARELRTATDDEVTSTADLVGQMSAHREVVDVLMSLPDTYRDVLLWRYFEGDTPTRIAERRGIPISTVKTRLARGLAAMRERLDRRHGNDGKRWLAVLAPLAKPRASATLFAESAVVILAAVILVSTAAIFLERSWEPGRRGELTKPKEWPATIEVAKEPSPSRADAAVKNTPPDAPPNARGDAGPFAAIRRGRVLDVDGYPRKSTVVQHVPWAIQVAAGSTIAITDDDGRFEMRGAPSGGRIQVLSNDLVTVLSGLDGTADALVVVAERMRLSGAVHDGSGRPVAGARVEVVPSDQINRRVVASSGGAWPTAYVTFTDGLGSYSFDAAPRVAGARLVTSREGFLDTEVALPLVADAAIPIVLRRPDPRRTGLRGRVVDPMGNPVADARVSDGRSIWRTDETGAFFVPVADGTPKPFRIMAVKEGHLPAVHDLEATQEPEAAQGLEEATEPIELRLGGAPRTLRGIVVDRDGRGLPGAEVWIDDPTVLAHPSLGFLSGLPANDLSHPNQDDDDDPRTATPESYLGASPARKSLWLVESELQGQAGETWPTVTTGPDGRFELPGLCNRVYQVAARDRDGWLVATPQRAQGSQDVRIVIDRDAVLAQVEGLVVAEDGTPVAGARVRVEVQPFTLRHGQREVYSTYSNRAWQRSDSVGKFRLTDVPITRARLRLEGSWIIPAEISITGEGPIRVAAKRAAGVQVDVGLNSAIDRFQVFGANGDPVDMHAKRGAARARLRSGSIWDGVSESLMVPVDVKELAFYAGTAEVRRLKLHLTPGQAHVIRP